MRCPVSWLRLEQYALGELSGAEREAVRAHVESCEECRRFLRQIEDDRRPLPALPMRRRRPWGLAAVAGLAIAAGVGLVVVPKRDDPQTSRPGSHRRVKGGDLAITLVRDRAGRVQRSPSRFREGDRFQAYVTCPPGAHRLVVEVRQDGIDVLADGVVSCGNEVPVGPAFALTGRRETAVCVTWDPTGDTVCQRLDPIDE